MVQVVAIKEDMFFHGNAEEVSAVVGRCSETVRRWCRDGRVGRANGWSVYVKNFKR